jgi:hypothetical protein
MSLLQIQRKGETIAAGTSINIGETGVSGCIVSFWLAYTVSGAANQILIRIYIDGEVSPSYGTSSTSSSTENSIAGDIHFTPGFAGAGALRWADSVSGNNEITSTRIGGYLNIPIPFTTSYSVELYNASSQLATYYIQLSRSTSVPPSLLPYKLYCKPFTLPSMSTSPPTFATGSIMQVAAGASGLYLKGIKIFLRPVGSSWLEGLISIYSGTASFPTNTTATYTGNSSTPYIDYYSLQSGSVLLCQSSGFEDFFKSSWGFPNLQVYDTPEVGRIKGTDAGTDMTAYRFFGNTPSDSNGMIFVPSGRLLTICFNVGNVLAAAASSVSFALGCVWYYM